MWDFIKRNSEGIGIVACGLGMIGLGVFVSARKENINKGFDETYDKYQEIKKLNSGEGK